jgi:oligopeptide transport system ATP-binding protein
VEVKDLRKTFPIIKGFLRKTVGYVKAVDNVSFGMIEESTLGLVGETGSGKSTLAKILAGIHRPTSGEIWFDGKEISRLPDKQFKNRRREIQIVFQDPTSSLNPRRRVRDIIAAPLAVNKIGTKSWRLEKVAELLDLVNLPKEFMYSYPPSLSGGEKQRIAIARAVVLNPRVVILDEPTSSLDVSVQAKVLDLLMSLQKRLHLTYLLISHDLAMMRNFSDRVAVMYLGKIVEMSSVEKLLSHPLHPYTQMLLSSFLVLSDEEQALLPKSCPITGEISSAFDVPTGCAFHPRCPKKMKICEIEEPQNVEYESDHFVKCCLFS